MLERYLVLKELLRETALLTGDAFFRTSTRAFARLLGADFAFIARLRDRAQGQMEVLASCQHGEEKAHWSFSLPGTPCSLLYAGSVDADWVDCTVGGAVSINDSVFRRFDSVRNTAYEAFIGIPLHDADRVLVGHVALFFERRWTDAADRETVVELVELFSYKVQAELNRSLLEEQRERAVHELEQANQRLLTETITDHLTRLHNRRHFSQRMQEAFAQFRRGACLHALLLLDLDHFKSINDQYGHDTGDEVLRVVAQALRVNCRAESEPIFRIGGEEFAVLCFGELGPVQLQRFGERINEAIRAARLDSVPGMRLSVSIGAARPQPDDASWANLYRRADAAMYRAKQGGRDRTVLFESDPSDNG